MDRPTTEVQIFKPTPGAVVPALIGTLGPAATFAWDEFFSGQLRNPHTRKAYLHAVLRFLEWLEPKGTALLAVTPGMVGAYLDHLEVGPETKKLQLTALRRFFDVLVNRHVIVLNPAASVRGQRHQVVEGRTPEISLEHARLLMRSINTDSIVGCRDLAIIATLIYTAARAGAVAKLRLSHFRDDGSQYSLRFEEKGGKIREIPVRHDLQDYLNAYLREGKLVDAPGHSPLFRSAKSRTGRLTDRPMSGIDVCRMVKRRLKAAGLSARLSPHSFRVATVTDLLMQGVPLTDVQYLAGHADPRTTRLYDRRPQRVTRNLVERISI